MIETIYRVKDAPHLALLSDLHNREFDEIVESLERHRPEMICIAGDVVNGHEEHSFQSNVLPFLAACAGIAPSHMSLGNHERILEDLQEIEETGVTVLDNSYRTVTAGEKTVVIGGLTSARVSQRRAETETHTGYDRKTKEKETAYKGHYRRPSGPEMDWLEEYVNTSGYHILLSHHPEYFPLIPSGIELTLSGHAHGGQWRFFGRGVFAPGQGLLPKYTSGVYEEDGKLMVVGRGLSNTAPVPRINNPVEIVYVK